MNTHTNQVAQMATLNTAALQAAHELGWLANHPLEMLPAVNGSVASAIKLLAFVKSRDRLGADSNALEHYLGQHRNSIFILCRWLEGAGYLYSHREESAGAGGKMIYYHCPRVSYWTVEPVRD